MMKSIMALSSKKDPIILILEASDYIILASLIFMQYAKIIN